LTEVQLKCRAYRYPAVFRTDTAQHVTNLPSPISIYEFFGTPLVHINIVNAVTRYKSVYSSQLSNVGHLDESVLTGAAVWADLAVAQFGEALLSFRCSCSDLASDPPLVGASIPLSPRTRRIAASVKIPFVACCRSDSSAQSSPPPEVMVVCPYFSLVGQATPVRPPALEISLQSPHIPSWKQTTGPFKLDL
jgi:hypothetical protein